jgi:hypothetical protein
MGTTPSCVPTLGPLSHVSTVHCVADGALCLTLTGSIRGPRGTSEADVITRDAGSSPHPSPNPFRSRSPQAWISREGAASER